MKETKLFSSKMVSTDLKNPSLNHSDSHHLEWNKEDVRRRLPNHISPSQHNSLSSKYTLQISCVDNQQSGPFNDMLISGG